jgi:hypothetical protein
MPLLDPMLKSATVKGRTKQIQNAEGYLITALHTR